MAKRINVMFIMACVILVASGIGYAYWGQKLVISGTVKTGYEDPIFVSCFSTDPPLLGSIDPGEDKDVGSCSCSIDVNDPSKIIVTILNAYPGYRCEVYTKIRNAGTVPINITDVNITAPPEIVITHCDLLGREIEPNVQIVDSITIDVKNVSQSVNYTFTVEIKSKLSI